MSLIFLLFTNDISYFIFKMFGLTDETYNSQFNPLFALITLLGFLGGLFIGYKFSNNQQARSFSWGMIVLANLALIAFMYIFLSLFYLTFSSQHTTWQFISMRLSQISLPLVITTLTCIWMNYQIAPRGYQFKVTLGAILFFHGLLFILRLLSNVYPQWDAYFNQENLIDLGFTLLGILVGIGIGLLMGKQHNSSSQIAL